jgi:hypothetical protein
MLYEYGLWKKGCYADTRRDQVFYTETIYTLLFAQTIPGLERERAMHTYRAYYLISILFISVLSISGCYNRSHRIAFRAQSSLVSHSDSSWSEPVYAKKGQILKASYSVTIAEGIWAIWFTRSGKSDPKYHYSAYGFTGSYDVTMCVNK